jgi:hypothetical protein
LGDGRAGPKGRYLSSTHTHTIKVFWSSWRGPYYIHLLVHRTLLSTRVGVWGRPGVLETKSSSLANKRELAAGLKLKQSRC